MMVREAKTAWRDGTTHLVIADVPLAPLIRPFECLALAAVVDRHAKAAASPKPGPAPIPWPQLR